MIPHDFLTLHAAKTVEYLIAVSYLLLFIPFWRYVNGRPQPEEARVLAFRPATLRQWFAVPDGLFYHPGHAWLRVDGPDTVTVGIDDFAGKLVGVPSALGLPAIGARVAQGAPAWTVGADSRTVDMLSPVDGVVVDVNDRVRHSPVLAHDRPYDEGWLIKVRNANLAANLKQLLTGRLAQRWIEDVTDSLRGGLTPALGHVYEDGGVVIDGLARSLEPATWDEVARRFFLTDGGHHA